MNKTEYRNNCSVFVFCCCPSQNQDIPMMEHALNSYILNGRPFMCEGYIACILFVDKTHTVHWFDVSTCNNLYNTCFNKWKQPLGHKTALEPKRFIFKVIVYLMISLLLSYMR